MSFTVYGLSIEEETIENMLGVLPDQCESNSTVMVRRTVSARGGGGD